MKEYKYDVALSFAGEDRELARKLAKRLETNGYSVFYDENEEAQLWGKNLYNYFLSVYRDESRYCVVFVSENYVRSRWANHELQSALERTLREKYEYILPIHLDDTRISELPMIIKYIDYRLNNIDIERIYDLLVKKLSTFGSSSDKVVLSWTKPGRSDQSLISPESKIVFISFRPVMPDVQYAKECAHILNETSGLNIWFDEEREFLNQVANEFEIADRIANHIERGLDVASALLSIIGPESFDSPWIPYEVGAARGRQQFVQPFQNVGISTELPVPIPNPLIAHLIISDKFPEQIPIGMPLYDLADVKLWAESVAEILNR
ncbi:MAG: TIR domain-containing protein [Candidatus Poribacteria bacterium]|nr:TIR domain-containing protein [Candidatus Poribacteria bacterium]